MFLHWFNIGVKLIFTALLHECSTKVAFSKTKGVGRILFYVSKSPIEPLNLWCIDSTLTLHCMQWFFIGSTFVPHWCQIDIDCSVAWIASLPRAPSNHQFTQRQHYSTIIFILIFEIFLPRQRQHSSTIIFILILGIPLPKCNTIPYQIFRILL